MNGELVPHEQGRLSVLDRGGSYGDGLFETLRVEEGVPLFVDDHFARLEEGANVLRFSKVPSRSELMKGMKRIIQANQVNQGYLRLTLTRGQGGFGQLLSHLSKPTWWVMAQEHVLDQKRYREGISATFVSIQKNPRSPLSGVKSLNYLESILAREEALEKGREEGLMLTTEGKLCEGASANLFLVRGERLITPSLNQGPLPGTVRKWVLRQAQELGMVVEEREVEPEECYQVDESFFTNSTWGPFPCVRIGEHTFADGQPGIVTRRMMDAWIKAVKQEVRSNF